MYTQPCSLLSVSVCMSPATSQHYSSLTSRSTSAVMRYYDRVSIIKGPEVPGRQEGFWQNAFVNTREGATAGTEVQNKYCNTARSHNYWFFSKGPLQPINLCIVLV